MVLGAVWGAVLPASVLPTRARPQAAHPTRTPGVDRAIPPGRSVERTAQTERGDANIEEDEESYRVLRGLGGIHDLAVSLDVKQPTSVAGNPYRRRRHIEKRIDYVFYRDGQQQGLEPVSIQRDFDELLDFEGKPGGYSIQEVPGAVTRVFGQFLN